MTYQVLRGWPALLAVLLSGCGPAILVGAASTVTQSVIEERSTMDALSDTEVGLSIATRLGEHSGELFRDVDVDVVEQRVLLTGSVPRTEDRLAAEQIAWAAPGVRAVSNDLTVAQDAGTASYWQDVRLAQAVRFALSGDPAISHYNFNVTVQESVVHLTGLARSRDELQRAIRHAQGTAGATRVVSHVLLIDDPRRFETPPGQPAQETVAKGPDTTL